MSQIVIDDYYSLQWPAQGYCPLPQGILTFSALCIFKDLPQSALTYIKIGVPLEMLSPYLLR
jgi:hypothetical protein